MVQAQVSKVDTWRQLAQQLRVDSIRSTTVAGSGDPSSSMSAADLMAVLLSKYLKYEFNDPQNPNNDHLIFSKGHALHVQSGMIKRTARSGVIVSSGARPTSIEVKGPDTDRPVRANMRVLASNVTDDDGRDASCRRQRERVQAPRGGNHRFARSTAPVSRGACCHVPRKPRRRRSPATAGMLADCREAKFW